MKPRKSTKTLVLFVKFLLDFHNFLPLFKTDTMGMISIEGMEFFSYHGHFKEEQVIGTRFIVDLFIQVDTRSAEKSDKLNDTVNYFSVYETVKAEMAQQSHLLEHVANRILLAVHEQYPEVTDAEVKISKLNPPLGGKIDRVCVTLSSEDIYE
ncbi:MAG: dihydroneopterin aldolase [Lentimicrobiaceae bacterium]|jgi:dihydroneopterin aldolase|nr:dihydroneopterin aldolase [Lentimicrobiaceae bacterium]MDD4596897.1 dihydroneopterin aldolase [Lentimicrobiaceae bacterium]MDY0025764.1 dihydroneopterin aldolase [Lentimicrobium sp.]